VRKIPKMKSWAGNLKSYCSPFTKQLEHGLPGKSLAFSHIALDSSSSSSQPQPQRSRYDNNRKKNRNSAIPKPKQLPEKLTKLQHKPSAMSDYTSLLPLLGGMTSSDNKVRKEAEIRFNLMMETQTSVAFGYLTQCFVTQSVELIYRSFAGVLLRRVIERYGAKLTPNDTIQMRSAVMAVWGFETNATILKRLAHVIAQSAVSPEWKDLIPNIIGFATSTATASNGQQQQQSLLVAILNMLEVVAEYCPDDVVANLGPLSQFLELHLRSDNAVMQVACAKATGAVIICIEEDTTRDTFQAALQPIISVLGAALTRGDEADATNIMENLVTIAQMQVDFT
jgi:hypothetical protein